MLFHFLWIIHCCTPFFKEIERISDTTGSFGTSIKKVLEPKNRRDTRRRFAPAPRRSSSKN